MPILGKFGDLEEEDNLEVSHVSNLINYGKDFYLFLLTDEE